jgi:hypothetical protein
MINSSAAELYEILISKKDLGYYETDFSFTILVGNLQPYPADFKEILSLDYAVGDAYYPVHRFTNNERNLYHHSTTGTNIGRRYRLVQSGIKFLPEQGAAGDYRMTYIPRYINRTALTDDVGGLDLDNWHEYIIVDCVIKFLTKQETDASVFVMQKANLMDRINKSASNRDANEPYRLHEHTDFDNYHDTPPRY